MGYFPDKFKTAIIKFIPKENTDSTNPINYRPISLLEVTGKVLEKILNPRLRALLETKNILKDTPRLQDQQRHRHNTHSHTRDHSLPHGQKQPMLPYAKGCQHGLR